MWGCIVYDVINIWQMPVPSLYVRVYRRVFGWSAGVSSSLTVCEGVSFWVYVKCWRILFPHCMWGCIAMTYILNPECLVPSLYVRVYRDNQEVQGGRERSLTVCEGVSAFPLSRGVFHMFPHCMWGCIAPRCHSLSLMLVPSLYVRVYRHPHQPTGRNARSLTVCEGVSHNNNNIVERYRFPHCMWGCIDTILSAPSSSQVPSLYVRVYRPTSQNHYKQSSSLTVCEGVSLLRKEASQW